MALFEFLVNKSPLKNQRNRAQDMAREMYDPSTLNPMRELFSERAIEGIDDRVESLSRTVNVGELFRDRGENLYTGSASRGLAVRQGIDMERQRSLSGFEANLSMADIQAQREGEVNLAQTLSQQKQIQAQQDAAITEADLQYEAAVDRRAQQIGATVLGVAGSLLTTPFGGSATQYDAAGNVIEAGVASESLLERGLGSLFDKKIPEALATPSVKLSNDEILNKLRSDFPQNEIELDTESPKIIDTLDVPDIDLLPEENMSSPVGLSMSMFPDVELNSDFKLDKFPLSFDATGGYEPTIEDMTYDQLKTGVTSGDINIEDLRKTNPRIAELIEGNAIKPGAITRIGDILKTLKQRSQRSQYESNRR